MAGTMKELNLTRTVSQMQRCKEENYDCHLCESFEDCKEYTNWRCNCCGKATNYRSAYKYVFGKGGNH